MKTQNEKPQNRKRLEQVIASIVIVAFVMGTVAPVVTYARGASETIIPADVALNKIKTDSPAALSDAQLGSIKNVALSDARIKGIIGDQSYVFMSQSFLGNIKQTPLIWNPVLNINVNNKTDVAVEINMSNNSVIRIQTSDLHSEGPLSTSSTTAAFALDEFTGTSTISGIYATLDAPSYTSSPNVRFLVNGLEYSGSDAFSCTPADKFNDYWGQAGFDFKNKYVTYTDTSLSCVDQNSMLTYAPSDPYLFEIYSSTGPYWNIVDLDQFTGLSNLYTTSFTTSASTLATSDKQTSVWFENQDTTTTWAGDFTSSIQAYNAKYYSSAWTNWNADSQAVYDCSGTLKTQNVMNSDLKSGHTQAWNLTNFEPYHC